MKNLFPLIFDVEIIKYSKNSIYSNSIKIFLISDTNYKEMFLNVEDDIITQNKYMIYDEVDNMANPQSCELNIPINETKTQLENIELIFNLTKYIYNDIFTNDFFWRNININNNNVNDNTIHKYIISDIKGVQRIIIDRFYNGIVQKIGIDISNPLFNYFKLNILDYILTKQFNYDYGIPENYPINTAIKDKYKAIPYSGGDNPVYGSDFSDPILTQVLTYFCYYINLKKNKLRLIDKQNIIVLYEKEYIDDVYVGEEKNEFIQKFLNFFGKDIKDQDKDIEQYLEYKSYYLNNISDTLQIDNDKFELYVTSILNKNNHYYKLCKNISFTELLLHKNVKNIISFTGTAYIQLPQEPDIGYLDDKIVEYGSINSFDNIEQAIQDIIKNVTKTNLYAVNRSDSLIDDIFSCISNYDVLIDIGAVFINFTNETFKKRYRDVPNRKKYFVYFENAMVIYNLDTETYESKSVINSEEKDTFFYFSNKNITGVDAKEIMNLEAKGLVTLTNKTIIRDFSQGIFRMRNILDGKQSIDIIINKIMVDSEGGIMRGGCNMQDIAYDEIKRSNLFDVLKQNQDIEDETKLTLLLKQNMIGLIKENTASDRFILYIDPSTTNNHRSSLNFIINELELKNVDYDNINDINLISFLRKAYYANEDILKFIQPMIYQYFESTRERNVQFNRTTNIQDQKQVQVQEEKQSNISINVNRNLYTSNVENKYIVNANLNINNELHQQTIIICENMNNLGNFIDLFILYDKENRNIYVMNILTFNYYLLYNNIDRFFEKYIILSLTTNKLYGIYNAEEVEILIKIKIIIIQILHNIISTDTIQKSINDEFLNRYKLSFRDELFIKEHNDEITSFFRSFNKLYINRIYQNTTTEGSLSKKYNKYNKYNKYIYLNNKYKYIKLLHT
jgi:hypothetical protein